MSNSISQTNEAMTDIVFGSQEMQIQIVKHLNEDGWWFEPVIIDGKLIEFILENQNRTYRGFDTATYVLQYVREQEG